jgi:large subunit ribosomal protein L1
MSKSGKKIRQAKESLSAPSQVSAKEALDAVVKLAYAKFDESVDVDVVLGVDPTKGDQTVRGSVLLPHGTGKKVRIVAFVKGDHEEEATKAGADFVGAEDLVKKIQDGWMDFDAAVATPDLMGLVGKVARILGPRGLLPNKKIGTVTSDVGPIISDLKKGRVSFRNDKGGVVHAPFGRVSFGSEKLIENITALVKALKACKPASSKGKFIRKITVSSSMGVGVAISPDDLV